MLLQYSCDMLQVLQKGGIPISHRQASKSPSRWLQYRALRQLIIDKVDPGPSDYGEVDKEGESRCILGILGDKKVGRHCGTVWMASRMTDSASE